MTGNSKGELKGLARDDFHAFMLSAHFDLSRVKAGMNSRQIATRPSPGTA